jgi:hypothetical protein
MEKALVHFLPFCNMLGTADVVLGMNWFFKHAAVIVTVCSLRNAASELDKLGGRCAKSAILQQAGRNAGGQRTFTGMYTYAKRGFVHSLHCLQVSCPNFVTSGLAVRCKFRAQDKPDTSCFFVLEGTEKEAITKEIYEFNNSSWKG